MKTLTKEKVKEIFELITKLKHELEACRTGDNDTKVFDAVQTVNAIDYKLLTQANGAESKEDKLPIPHVMVRIFKARTRDWWFKNYEWTGVN